MNDDVESIFERALKIRAGKRIIRNGNNPSLFCDRTDGFEINKLEQRIGRSLDPDHACFRLDGVAHCFWVRHVEKTELEARRSFAYVFKEPIRSSVEIVARDHMVARIKELQNRGHGRQAGCEREAARSAFQVGDAALVSEASRILRSGILESLMNSGTRLHVG